MKRLSRIAMLSLPLLSGCNRPLVILTDATPVEVRKAIGARVEVDGIGTIGKGDDFLKAKNFGALVSPAPGHMMRENDQPVRVRGILREHERRSVTEHERQLGVAPKAFRIEDAEISPK